MIKYMDFMKKHKVISIALALLLIPGLCFARSKTPAKDITISDSGGFYSGSQVEAVLQEVGTSLSVGVAGPSSSVDDSLVRFDGVTGKIIQGYVSGAPTCGDTGICTFGQLIAGSISGNSGTATAAAADGTECDAGSYARGVDVSWNGEGCTDASVEIDSILSTHTAISAAHHTPTVSGDIDHSLITNVLTGQHHTKAVDADISHDGINDVSTSDHHAQTVDTFVTNKDSHNHLGGDGATIAHTSLDTVGVGDHHAKTVDADISHDAINDVSTSDHHTQTVDTFVTNKDAHDHVGGDGAQIDHDNTSNVSTSDHHVKTVNTDAESKCAGNQLLEGDGDCIATPAGGGGTMNTVKEDGVQLGGSDIVTLDFLGADFDLSESPDTEVNIVIEDSGIDHDATTNFVATEHVDWAGAGTGTVHTDNYIEGHSNGGNCGTGSYPLGVDASGVTESCTDATTEIDSAILTHKNIADAHQSLVTVTDTAIIDHTLTGQDLQSTVVADSLDFTEFSDSMALDVDTTISTGSSTLTLQCNNPGSGCFDFNGTGAFTGDLIHAHQHTGNPGAGNILHAESEDMDITPIIYITQSAADITSDIVGLLIDSVDNDDINFIPLEIRDDSGVGNDLLFKIDYTGTVTSGIWDAGAVTSSGTIEGATLTEGGVGVYNINESDGAYQPLDVDLTTIAGLTATSGNVMFSVGSAWASDATPAIDCTDCTNIPAGTSHTGTLTWSGTSILESGVAFQFGDATDATLTHTYANTGTDVTIAYSTAAMAVTGALSATNLSGTNTGDVAEVNNLETVTTGIVLNEVPIGTAADDSTYKLLPSCSNTTASKLLYNNSTQTFTCGTDQTGGGSALSTEVGGVEQSTDTAVYNWTANDFNLTESPADDFAIALDYANGQAAASGTKGYLIGADWDTFNGKQSALVNSAGLRGALNDETGGAGLAVMNINPTLIGVLMAGIIADDDDMVFEIDANNDGSNKYSWTDGASVEIMSLTEAGLLTIQGSVTTTSSGQSLLSSGLVVNDAGGGAAADIFRVEGTSEPNLLVVTASSDLITMGDLDTNYIQITKAGVMSLVGTARLPIFSMQLNPEGAKLPESNPIGIDAGNLQWRGLFDDTTDECARWQSVLTPYSGGGLNIDMVYTLETTSTTDVVELEVYVMCGKSDADVDIDSFDTVNNFSSGAVSTTAGYQAKLSGALTNDDSCAEDDVVIIKVCRDADATDTTADDVEFRGGSVHE